MVLESRHLMGLFVLMVVIFGVVFLLGYELGRNQYGNQVRASDVQLGDSTNARSSPDADTLGAGAQPKTPPSDNDFYKSVQPTQPPANTNKSVKGATSSAKTNVPPASGAQPAPAKIATPPAAKTTPAPNKTINPPGKAAVTPPQPGKNAASTKTPPVNQPAKVKSQSPGLNAPLIPRGAYLIQVAAMTKQSDALAMAGVLQQKKFPAFVLSPGADKFYHVQVGPYGDQKTAEAARKALENAGFKTLVKH